MTFTLDTSPFSRAASQLFELQKKSTEDFLKQQGRLFLEEAAKRTPPFTFHSLPLRGQTWALQKKIGDGAKARDIRKLFRPVASFRMVAAPATKSAARLAKNLKRYIKTGNTGAVATILQSFGVRNKVIQVATYGVYLHHLIRGRIRKGVEFYIVLQASSIGAVIKKAQEHTGSAKAGWDQAGSQLKLRLPQWITRHGTPGRYEDHSREENAYLLIGNLTQYAPDFRHLDIVGTSLAARADIMRANARLIVEANLKKASK